MHALYCEHFSFICCVDQASIPFGSESMNFTFLCLKHINFSIILFEISTKLRNTFNFISYFYSAGSIEAHSHDNVKIKLFLN